MDFLSQTYTALRGPTGLPQTAPTTISRLSDRLSPATLLADRRAAVLALKGLVRGHKSEVGEQALKGLEEVLVNDAEVDGDIGRGVLETLSLLCDTTQGERELGYKHTDQILTTPKTVHFLFSLLGDSTDFYTRLGTLQFLSVLLNNRRAGVQAFFLTCARKSGVVGVLEDGREVIRNEALSTLLSLTSSNPEIQKILAFEGIFDKLFNIIVKEGGIDSSSSSPNPSGGGGYVVREALGCVDALLRFNSSNQAFFLNSPHPPTLPTLLLFPPSLPLNEPAPQEFALQFWDGDKLEGAGVVVGIIGMLIRAGAGGGGGTTKGMLENYTRCLIELALASNAPTPLKTKSLSLLPPSLQPPLSPSSHTLTPYIPVPETNGEEWDRLEPATALDVIVDLGVNGEYGGVDLGLGGGGGGNQGVGAGGEGGAAPGVRFRDNLELRAAALGVFENFVRREEIRNAIVEALVDGGDPHPPSPLLTSLASPPPDPSSNSNSQININTTTVTSTQFASLLFAALLRNSASTKKLAMGVVPNLGAMAAGGGGFFVPADGPPQQLGEKKAEDGDGDGDEGEGDQTLLTILTENLNLSFLSRYRSHPNPTPSANPNLAPGSSAPTATAPASPMGTTSMGGLSDRQNREWDRLITSYLSLLSQWLWDEPGCVREFLNAGGLGGLVEQVNQVSESGDPIVPGLCAFLLGICYEFNREPGEITRQTIYPIITRLGIDTLSGHLTRLREDERFKSVGPEGIVLAYPTPSPLHIQYNYAHAHSQGAGLNSNLDLDLKAEYEGEAEVWFDWGFVDFWKSNYYSIQRAFGMEPDQFASSSSLGGQNVESAMLIASLRDVIRRQAEDIEELRNQLTSAAVAAAVVPVGDSEEVTSLKSQTTSLQTELSKSEEKRRDVEKEQEDLLVLLDEVSSKRRRDKERMRGVGLEVSEDEGDEEEEDGDGEE